MSEPSPETRKQIGDALKADRVEMTDWAAGSLASMDWKNPDHTLTEAKITRICGPRVTKFDHIFNGSIEIQWKTVSAGWGELVVYFDENFVLHCDNEAMSKTFIKEVLLRLLME